jgi:hypothetical protein
LKRVFFSSLLLFQFMLQAQDSIIKKDPALVLRLTLYDWPYMNYAANTVSRPVNSASTADYFRSYVNPGMDKATAASNSLYSALHYTCKRVIKTKIKFLNKYLSNLCAGAADLLLMYAPLGDGWLHEEYHRSMMTLHSTNSFNDMNTFPIGKEVVSVHSVYDADLARMKAESNPDFVRMAAAGIEGQYNQIRLLQKDNFFYRQDLPHTYLYLLSTINSAYYVITTSLPSSNDLTNKMMAQEGTDISKRDFTGLDFDAWVYDLFRPNEPYSNRGIHPSGIGYKRYIRPSDLTSQELSYLRTQGYLQLINALSPAMATFSSIKIKSTDRGNYYGNIAFRHILTSFGMDISTDVFLKTPKHNWFFSAHLYQNKNCAFPGLEGEWIDEPLKLGNKHLLISSKIMLWTQPSQQSFFSYTQQPGGFLSVIMDYPICKNIFFSVNFKAKTEGWVMGETFIKQNASVLCGIRSNFYR